MEDDTKKVHRKRQAGPKADKKSKDKSNRNSKNAKAFGFQSVKKAAKTFHRRQDIETKRQHVPLVDRTPLEPPPIIVGIVGPPKVGKTTLIRSLIKNFTRQKLSDIRGPVTLVSGKKQRITLIECNNDVNCMIDIAKVADLVLLLIDASFGFEMEIFEFLNIAQVHGFPKIMGVLTHLDLMKNNKSLRKTKKKMKNRFWTEVYQGAKLFNLSGITHGSYAKTEIHNLGRFISVMKYRPLKWRTTHPHILADRLEDLTDPEIIRQKPNADRTVCLYGYMRGVHLRNNTKVHIMGCGDYHLKEISFLPDPCPLPEKEKKRSLNEKERLIYAPMSGVGGVVYDKDAVYIDLGGSKEGQRSKAQNKSNEGEGENNFLSSLLDTKSTIDTKMSTSHLELFKNSRTSIAPEIEGDQKWEIPLHEDVKADDNRIRRKVIFDDQEGIDSGDENDDDEDGDDDEENGDGSDNDEYSDGGDDDVDNVDIINDEDGDEAKASKRSRKDYFDEDIEFEEENEDFEDDDENEDFADGRIVSGAQSKVNLEELEQWKKNFKVKLLPQLMHIQNGRKDLRALIYDNDNDISMRKSVDNEDDDEEMLGGLFSVKSRELQNRNKRVSHQRDCSRDLASLQYTDENERTLLYESVKNCFVSRGWKNDDTAELDDDDDDEMFGDFEDLETGDIHGNTERLEDPEEDSTSPETEGKSEEKDAERRLAEKTKLKKSFDAEYDNEVEEGKDGDLSYYENLKKESSLQGQLNMQEFQDMEDEQRVQYEGFRPGMYVRVEIQSMPCEFVENFDPSYPVIIGGLLAGEDDIGFLQARFKKHRWHDKILKNRDPIIISLGWRRFQTLPLYSVQDHNGRQRALKYTPEHLHCLTTFYGPLTPPSTGLLAVQSVSGVNSKFRICGTGVIVDQDKSLQVVKKLKLIGTPMKVFKNTAFIKGMFNSSLEVAKFEGAAIRTVSGVRGQIKRSIKSQEGAYRATFEDKILMSDIVFCRTWYPVTCPKYYNPVTSLLLNKENSSWTGMRTVGAIRKERGLTLDQNTDSIYKPIERQARKFNPLHIPSKLQKDLPFKSKPKLTKKQKRKTTDKLKAVVMDSHEKKAYSLMKELLTIQNDKKMKQREILDKKRKEFKRKLIKDNARRDSKIKEQKRRIYKILGQEEKKKQKAAAGRS